MEKGLEQRLDSWAQAHLKLKPTQWVLRKPPLPMPMLVLLALLLVQMQALD
jgi:hypothetical protein